MLSTPVFSNATSSDIQHAIRQTPFLNLEWHFSPMKGIGTRLAELDQKNAAVPLGLNFETFKQHRISQRSIFAKAVMAALAKDSKSQNDLNEFADLDLFAEFVVGLDPTDTVLTHLRSFYEKLSEVVNHSLTSPTEEYKLGHAMLPLLLDPGLKWRDQVKADHEIAGAILESIESVIHTNSSLLRSGVFSDSLLEIQNCFIYCYLMLASNFDLGIQSTVVSEHLLMFRLVSSAGWAAVDTRTRMQYATLVLYLTLAFYPADRRFQSKLGFSNNTLADLRNVFRDAAGIGPDVPFTTHQWVFRWFAEKLDAEVFSIRGFRGNPNNLAVLSEGEQNAIVQLSMRFGSYRYPVTTDRLATFLLQFQTTERIRGALRMLTHSRFFPLWELGASMENLLGAELADGSRSQLVVAPLGDQTGSTAIIKYMASHSSLGNKLQFATDLNTALLQTDAGDELYFVDDCLLSGTQTLNILGDLMGTRKHAAHHTVHCNPLSPAERKAFLARRLVFAYCVVTEIGENRFLAEVAKTGINPENVRISYGVMDHSKSKAFEPLGPVGWSSTAERNAIKEFSQEVGYDILRMKSREKEWTDARRRESALGYSDFQRLLIFPYNVPKTTVTLLWETGDDQRPWTPLFLGFD